MAARDDASATGAGPARPTWTPDFVPDVDDSVGIAWLRRAISVVLLAGVVAMIVAGADRPADPVLGDPAPQTQSLDSSAEP